MGELQTRKAEGQGWRKENLKAQGKFYLLLVCGVHLLLSRTQGIAKLEDANDAGTKNSRRCTLILTEGDSAKTLAVAGLGVIGRDCYGVFPLRGKLLNVRDAPHKQVLGIFE
jgi:hypothetical protein